MTEIILQRIYNCQVLFKNRLNVKKNFQNKKKSCLKIHLLKFVLREIQWKYFSKFKYYTYLTNENW